MADKNIKRVADGDLQRWTQKLHGVNGTPATADVYVPSVHIQQSGITNALLFQYMTDSGSPGVGVDDAIGDYETTPLELKIKPAAGDVVRIDTVEIMIQDNVNSFRAENYGGLNSELANGIVVEFRQPLTPVVRAFTDTHPVKSNGEWAAVCGNPNFALVDWGAGDSFLLATLKLIEQGQPIRIVGDLDEELVFIFNDDFSGLVHHRFLAKGIFEGKEI